MSSRHQELCQATTTTTVTTGSTSTAVETPVASAQEMNSRPVLPCVQDFQPGCLGPAWLAAPRDVPPRSDLASDWSMSVILASDWSGCCSLYSWLKVFTSATQVLNI